jgi:hypothetical protein
MITATKKKGGWEAEDQFPFMGARRLSIRTYKFAGKLTTWAAVNKYYDGGYEHAFGLGRGGDFSERTIESNSRALEKTVVDQHARALAMLPEIMERARAHYEKFPPRD